MNKNTQNHPPIHGGKLSLFTTGDNARYVTTMSDAGFKIVYFDKDNMLFLINSVLGEGFASDLTFTNNEKKTLDADGKTVIADMTCTTPDGSKVLVEVQVAYKGSLPDRMLAYGSFLIQEQLNELLRKQKSEQNLQRNSQIPGKSENKEADSVNLAQLEDYNFSSVYVIAFVGYDMPQPEEEGVEHSDNFIRTAKIHYDDNFGTFSDKISFTTIEVLKFFKKEEELSSNLDSVVYSFRNMGMEKSMPGRFKDTPMEKIYTRAELAKMNTEDRFHYFGLMMDEMWDANAMSEVKKYHLAQGREEGREEERIQIALKLLSKGFSDELISELTELSIDEVIALKEKYQP